MKMQDKDMIAPEDGTPVEQGNPSPGRSVMASIGALLIVALLITVSVAVFTLFRNGKGTGALPRGQWKGVLNGYNIASLVASRSNPAILYACAASANTVQGATAASYTLWRSSNYGDTWSNSGADSTVQGTCQLAVNTTNSDDVYMVGGAATTQTGASVLKHSSDGGHTWTSIRPVLQNAITPWSIQSISVVGNVLFGVQWLNAQAGPPRNGRIDQAMPAIVYSLAHLIESADGGQHWMAIDTSIATTPQSVHSYSVDPSNAHIVYEILGTPWQPMDRGTNISGYGMNETLYKTTDNGKTWNVLLKNLRVGSSIQVASGKPNILYIGGSLLRMPNMPGQPQNTSGVVHLPGSKASSSASSPVAYSNFLLQMSRDGGATWQQVPQPAQLFSVQNWFVSADGQFYSFSDYAVAPGTKSGSTNVSAVARIMRYDPGNNAWQEATKAPLPGSFIAVTANGTNGTLLWFLALDKGKLVLYRYTV